VIQNLILTAHSCLFAVTILNGFLPQANFQFLLLPGTNLSHESFFNPDVLVDWDAVESVRFPLAVKASSTSDATVTVQQQEEDAGWRCPICLERPRCARISRCGHGPYCTVCILRVSADQ
jgi:Zinc finger, C3HC4 type (RING finger)